MSAPAAVDPPVIIATATAPEYRCVARAVRGAAGLTVIQTGVGASRARAAIIPRLSETSMGLVSAGTAAGLHPDLPAGTLLLPARIRLTNGATISVDSRWQARLHGILGNAAATGDLLEVPTLQANRTSKQALFARTGAMGADMESGALAQLARQTRVPFLVLRVVLDTARDVIPQAAAASLDESGNLDLGALLAALLHRPRDVAGLWKMTRGFAVARTALMRALSRVAPVLGAGPEGP